MMGLAIDESSFREITGKNKHRSLSSSTSRTEMSETSIMLDEESSVQERAESDTRPTIRSCLKTSTSSEQLHVKESARSWKCLPAPDMSRILRNTVSTAAAAAVDDEAVVKRNVGVSFSQLQIRCYSQTVGDNPSVSYGAPIQLDWDYEAHEPICIDEWEDNRPKRRNLKQMIMNYYKRRNILSWQYGVSEEELKAAKRDAKKVKFERSVTNILVPAMPFEAAIESARRKAKRFLKNEE